MNRRALTPVAGLVLLGALALPAHAADRVAVGEPTVQALVEEIRRLQRALGTILPLRTEDGQTETGQTAGGTPSVERTPHDLREHVLSLRREADEFLEFLEAQPPEVLAEVERLLSASAQARRGVELPASPAAPLPGGVEALAERRAEAAPPPGLRPPAPRAEPECAEFRVFDTNEDGVVSGLDRYWRYFRLWRDDGDGAIEEKELSGLYDAGVRELTTALGTYRTEDGVAGDVLGGGPIRLDLGGKKGRVLASLVIDADRLARGGELELRDGSGGALSGLQALASEMAVASADGLEAPLSCARASDKG